jgi:predicted PurR-regulated permease PerM
VLFCGDKVVRPLVSRHGLRLRFVWILMAASAASRRWGSWGSWSGPVVLTLARELWAQRVRDVTPAVEDSR